MKNNYLTVILQPDWHATSRSFNSIMSLRFHKRVIWYLALGTLLLIGFGLSGTFNIRENIVITKRIDSLEKEFAHLSGIVSHVENIRRDEKIIRESLGIETLGKNYDINERLGQGGAESDENDDLDLPSFEIEDEIEELVDTRPLHIRVNDLREDVHELLQALSTMTATLTCRPTIMPIKDSNIWITSGFGWRKSPFTGLRQFHKGLDVSGRKGSEIIVTADGVVKQVGFNRFIGKYVKIKHDDQFSTSYGHLLKHNVKKGDRVKRGDVVGFMGTSGMSTGYHLHYEVIDNEKKVNPYNFILNRHEHTLASSL